MHACPRVATTSLPRIGRAWVEYWYGNESHLEAELADGNGFVAADIDPELPGRIRNEFPALSNRRLQSQ